MTEEDELEVRKGRSGEDSFTYYVRQLGRFAFVLRALSVILAVGTAIAVLGSPAAIAPEKTAYGTLMRSSDFLPWAYLIGFNVLVALVFESLRKRGDAIFEELSDEFQWYLGSDKKRSAEIGPVRPPIDLRVALRTFLASADLLLAPGRLGPLIYSLINISLFVMVAMLRWRG